MEEVTNLAGVNLYGLHVEQCISSYVVKHNIIIIIYYAIRRQIKYSGTQLKHRYKIYVNNDSIYEFLRLLRLISSQAKLRRLHVFDVCV